DPHNATAHHTRAGQPASAHDDAWLEQLAAAYARRGSVSPKEAVRLSFAMGKVREDLGEYDAAFDAYAEGNRLHHALHPCDEAREESFVKAMTTALGSDLYSEHEQRERPRQRASDSRVPIFVVGMPRSGTSLVEQILSTHPQISGAGELHTLGELLAPVAAVPSRGDRAPWIAKLRAAGEEYLAQAWTGVQTDFLVDKMPHNFRLLGALPFMIPGAKVIHVTRDPLDTCFSCFATAFFESHEYSYDQGTLGRHYVRYQRLMDHWRRVLPPASLLEVSYEALIHDIQGETRRMLEYVGVAWSEACMRFHENRRVVKTASRVQVTQPIYTRSIGRSRRFEKHLAPLHAALAPTLQANVT
ncbi:MAG: sulfotransferase family protein, partial [Steroidobacteraceae bacterium]